MQALEEAEAVARVVGKESDEENEDESENLDDDSEAEQEGEEEEQGEDMDEDDSSYKSDSGSDSDYVGWDKQQFDRRFQREIVSQGVVGIEHS